MKRERTDFKRNNRVGLRNFSESSDFHDLLKTLLVRMLRRKHKDNHNVPIYTEYSPDKPNDEYPDIWMRIKKDIIVYEIQKSVTNKWLKETEDNYSNVDLIIVETKKIKEKWEESMRRSPANPIKKLKKILEDYVV